MSQNKEVNLSIEETNALRAKLGLKPLRLDDKDKQGSSSSSSSNKRPREPEAAAGDSPPAAAAAAAAATTATAADEAAILKAQKEAEEAAAAAAAAAEAKQKKEEAERQKRRVAHALLIAGDTIASAAAADADILDPLAWVSRMRKEKTEQQALATQGRVDRVRYDDESDSEAESTAAAAAAAAAGAEETPGGDVPAARVAHEASDLLSEESVVLTLKDAEILAPDGSLNEEEDVLESLQLREREKLQQKAKKLKQLQQKAVYDAAEELETGGKKDILSHYDEWQQEEAAAKGLARPPGEPKGFLLEDLLKQAAGGGAAAAPAAAAAAADGEGETETLGTPAFRKPKKQKKEKQRKTGKDFWLALVAAGEEAAAEEEEDAAATATAGASSSNSSSSNSSSSSSSKEHHASRHSKEPKEKNAQKEKVADALAVATRDRERHPRQDGPSKSSKSSSSSSKEASSSSSSKEASSSSSSSSSKAATSSSNSSSRNRKQEEKVKQLSEVIDEELGVYEQPKAGIEEEEDPTEAEKQRLLAQILRRNKSADPEGQEKGLLPKTAMLVELAQQTKAEEKEEEGLQLTNTTEFCRSVLTPLEKARASARLTASIKPTKGIKITNSSSTKTQRASPAGGSEQREEAEEGEVVDPEPEEMEEEEGDSEPDFMGEEPIGNSVSGALAYLQSKDFFSLDKIRRRRGHHLEQPLHNVESEREVNIDYRDAFGNVMTAKDAFRRISWHFHGKFPSLNKQEKKLKKLELERRLQENLMESLPTLKALQRVQEGDGSAHLVLTGGSLGS